MDGPDAVYTRPTGYSDEVSVWILADYSIQPVRPYTAEERAGLGSEINSRLARGADLASTKNVSSAIANAQVSASASTPAETEPQFNQLSGLAAQLQGEGHITAAQLSQLMTKLSQSIEGGDVVLTPEEQAVLKALIEQSTPSELARRILAASGPAQPESTYATDVNGVRLDSRALQSLQQIFQPSQATQASASHLVLSGDATPDIVINGLAAGLTSAGQASLFGKGLVASGDSGMLVNDDGNAASLAKSLASLLAGGPGRESISLGVLDLAFIRTTRQVATLLLTDQAAKVLPNRGPSQAVDMNEASSARLNSNPPLNNSRLESLMLTLRGIAPFLENGNSAAILDRLGQWVGAIGNAVADLDTPGAANASRTASLLQSPGMRNLIAQGFSFDLAFEPSGKVDAAIGMMKANGFEVLRVTDTADSMNLLRITVPGRDAKALGPIHLDLHAAETSTTKANANVHTLHGNHAQTAGLVNANADAGTLQGARLAGEASASLMLAHAGAEAASSASDNDPIRQLGIPTHTFSHQLDPIMMGWVAFYQVQRPVNDVPVDPVENFQRVTRPPLMLEYKPIEVIYPGAASVSSSIDGILDVENFTVS